MRQNVQRKHIQGTFLSIVLLIVNSEISRNNLVEQINLRIAEGRRSHCALLFDLMTPRAKLSK